MAKAVLRVALDLRGLHQAMLNSPSGGLGGPGMYCWELARHLVQAAEGTGVEWVFVVYPEKMPARLVGLAQSGAHALRLLRGPRLSRRLMHSRYSKLAALADAAALSTLCRDARVDVYHSLEGLSLPWAAGATRTVCTVHDLYDLVGPGAGDRRLGQAGGPGGTFLIGWPPRRASRVVTVSQDTADDVHRLLDVPKGRIQVIYPGVHPLLVERGGGALAAAAVAPRMPVAGPFFLHVGVLRPRKNPQHILPAVARVVRDTLPDHSLVCVGPYQTAPGLATTLNATWQGAGGPADRLILLGDVSDEMLVNLYARATGLVFPSLHEGFGQTVAEALAVGTPVVTSRAGATPESGGDLAIYVDPLDTEAIAAGCLRMAQDAALRERVRHEGPPWIASRFTWPLASQQVLDLYRGLEGGRPC